MPYQDHFKLADDYIAHLDTAIASITDPFIRSRYVGFVALSAATVFELAIKEIFCAFAARKHRVLGNFTSVYFDRLNGQIGRDRIQNTYLRFFGEKYSLRFKTRLEKLEKLQLRSTRQSVKTSYSNLLVWRHTFAHEGNIPASPTYEEVKDAYRLGRMLVDCLADCLRR